MAKVIAITDTFKTLTAVEARFRVSWSDQAVLKVNDDNPDIKPLTPTML